jgi:sugar transferase (PEP-CTERM/EpsH1 system associated)
MDILYVSHCVPNPPDKGEKIRAFHEVKSLATGRRVHLACFARSDGEKRFAEELGSCCASVYVETLRPWALASAAARFAFGNCLTTSFYGSRRFRDHVAALAARTPLAGAVVYSSAMAQYVPTGVPAVIDMVDVDSEKWFQYARLRWPGTAYSIEGRRLRRAETAQGAQATRLFFATAQEEALYRSFAPEARTGYIENGVDGAYFEPDASTPGADLAGRSYLMFLGAMDYYPNAAACAWFATRVFPELRRRNPAAEFLIVGRNPGRAVRRLAAAPGVTVSGSVPDVRPYLRSAAAVVAPLEIARGIQNKVLEALAMGKRVLASTAVCHTFGAELPEGVVRCAGEREFLSAAEACLTSAPPSDPQIRRRATARFSWESNLRRLTAEVDALSIPAARC